MIFADRAAQRSRIPLLTKSRHIARLILSCAIFVPAAAQQIDNAQLLKRIDAAVRNRFDGIESYTDFEHYLVFRGGDQTHPAAEMRVKTTYNRDRGKTYDILSSSGSSVLRDLVLGQILANERHVNEPSVREGAWITSANYKMTVNPGGIITVDGRPCAALTLEPRRREPYLVNGTLWVNVQDGSIVRIEGVGSKSSSVFSGATHMMRQYVTVGRFSQAVHARAESDSGIFGQTVVTIDYSGYQIEPRQAR